MEGGSAGVVMVGAVFDPFGHEILDLLLGWEGYFDG